MTLGAFSVAIGVIGAFLPLLPSTIFFIAAAGCFAKSSPRLEEWIVSHPQFGPGVRAWRENGAIAPRAKMLAVGGMGFGFYMFYLGAEPDWPLALAVALTLACCAAYVLSRPTPET
ncbi:YbaN family protein [Stappia taiwanensis]|uniref:YbaN family protein n=1 Tax=Stappia taiwanensis TaxID=992267 RepID=A0A838Y2H8_9HYPH|nr:YbaN family protein [Stappia taiwanensis]MBA4613203.1 YbaN family protein [Stappia taiwanensis]GGE79542.1 hypothetical protein GCM10007285_04200 [Stappia taiwanensis]